MEHILDVERDPMGVYLICNAPGFSFNLYGLHETLLDTQTYPCSFISEGKPTPVLPDPQGCQCQMRYPGCG